MTHHHPSLTSCYMRENNILHIFYDNIYQYLFTITDQVRRLHQITSFMKIFSFNATITMMRYRRIVSRVYSGSVLHIVAVITQFLSVITTGDVKDENSIFSRSHPFSTAKNSNWLLCINMRRNVSVDEIIERAKEFSES